MNDLTFADADSANQYDDEAYTLTREEILRRAIGGGVVVGAGGLANAASAFASRAPAAVRPKRGGTLRVGSPPAAPPFAAVDAHTAFGWSATLRIVNLYENLVVRDRNWQMQNVLAEEVTRERRDTWLIRVKPGIRFHNGKRLTIDDVIFSIRRMAKTPGANSSLYFSSVDLNGFKKLDTRTVRMKLKQPDSTIADALADYSSAIVPVGYVPRRHNGTGPFMMKSYTPGRQSVMVRNPNYWRSGLPYVDELIIFDLQDESARVNALLSGQVHAIDHVPLGQVPVLRARRDVRVLESPRGPNSRYFLMRVDAPPFDNNDVRQAMRWIADRPQMVKQALARHGKAANDLFAPLDPCYNRSLPQRKQDLDRAKFLLRRAGQESLSVELVMAPLEDGIAEAAQVFAENAKGAGVTVSVKKVDVGSLYANYLKWPFSVGYTGLGSYLLVVAGALLPTSSYNETHWPDAQSRTRYLSLYGQARATLNEKLRCELVREMQKIEWNRGGYINWAFANKVDAHSTKIAGLRSHSGGIPLDRGNFKEVSFV